jgi:hypothetical protein
LQAQQLILPNHHDEKHYLFKMTITACGKLRFCVETLLRNHTILLARTGEISPAIALSIACRNII